jgi:hypothetical protein
MSKQQKAMDTHFAVVAVAFEILANEGQYLYS